MLFGKEVSFSTAADRFFYLSKTYEWVLENASNEFQAFYDDSENISNVLDNYMNILYTITEKWAIALLYGSLKNDEIYDVSEESFCEACWDLECAEPYFDCIADKYNQIVGDQSDAKHYRAMRKASRTKYGWVSSTNWGAMTNAAITAGTLNAISGIGHSVVNGIGNIVSSISAASSKNALYNDDATFEILDKGVRECITSIYNHYIGFVNEYKENERGEIWIDGSPYNVEKAETLLKNSREVKGKEKELLFRAFSVCPYHYEVSKTIFLKYEEERINIFKIAKKYSNDLTPLLEDIIKPMYSKEAKHSESKAQEVKHKIKTMMGEYGIAKNETFDQIEQDCLSRIYYELYLNSIPGENQEVLNAFVEYDASDANKHVIIKKFKIWELADQYKVEFDDNEKEEIISIFIETAKYIRKLENKTILEKIEFIMENLGLEESKTCYDFEYNVLDEFASEYKNLPVGGADDIIQQIISCFVSDSVKYDYIYNNDIWELVERYEVDFSDEEKDILIYNAFIRMISVNNVETKTVIDRLTEILKALSIMDDSGVINIDKRESLFELLSGMSDASETYESSVKTASDEILSTINEKIESIISGSGITFMTLSLSYRKDQVSENAKKLKYCTLDEDEQPFIIYDAHSIMNPHAYGFCLTDKRLIAKQESSHFEIPVEDITFFEKQGFLNGKVIVHTRTITKELDASDLSELAKFVDCLNNVIKTLANSKKAIRTKQLAFYKEYVEECVTCVENNAFLVDFFGAQDIVSCVLKEKSKYEETNYSSNDETQEGGSFETNTQSQTNSATTLSTSASAAMDNTIAESKNIVSSKKEMNGFLLTILLIICSPYIEALLLMEFLYFIPDILFFGLFFIIPVIALVLMWKKRSWNILVKLLITIGYVVMFFI